MRDLKTRLVSVLSYGLYSGNWLLDNKRPQYGFAHEYIETRSLLAIFLVIQREKKSAVALFLFSVF